MADLARIKRNVAKMASMGAPEADIDGYIASEGVTIDDVKNFGRPQLSPMTDEQRAQAEQMASEMRPQRENVALGALTGFGEGLAGGLSRIASGATLGAIDWLDRRLGGNVTDLNKKLQRRAEATGAGGLNRVANFVSEMGGLGGGASKVIMKGAKTIPQLIGKGAVEGGIFGATSSDSLGELARNIIGGAAVGGAGAGVLGAGGKMLKRLVPALNAEGKAKSLKDAFSDRESVIALKRGAKTSQELSDQIAEEMLFDITHVKILLHNFSYCDGICVLSLRLIITSLQCFLRVPKKVPSLSRSNKGKNPVFLKYFREKFFR